MATYIIVTNGPLRGEKFKIKGGEKIGRESGHIVLNDPKASSHHATIKRSLLGQLSVIDNKSKNGLIVEEKRVDRVKLSHGAEFRIGSNFFQVEVSNEGTDTQSKLTQENVNFSDPLETDSQEIDSKTPPPDIELNYSVSSDDTIDGEYSASRSQKEITDDELDNVNSPAKNADTFIYEPNSKPENPNDSDDDESTIASFQQKSEEDELFDLASEDKSASLSLKDLTIQENSGKDSKLSFRTLLQKSDESNEGLFHDPEKKTWSRVLEKFSRLQIKTAQDQHSTILPMDPRVKLTFFRGTQAETEWELGYGPRTAGNLSNDLPIWEPKAPSGDCFTITPSEAGPLFSTNFPNVVKLNGSSVDKMTLRSGDIISIAETEIEVELF